MSYELLLVGGVPGPDQHARRMLLMEHAAARVPGVHEWKILSTPTTVAAVVATHPEGGTVVEIDSTPQETQIVLALSKPGAMRVQELNIDRRELGAEAAHVSIRLPSMGGCQVSTDGTAFIPSFWGHHRSEFYFATHLASLISLGVSSSGDTQGMLEYLVMLHPLLDRTVFAGARALTAGSEINCDASGHISHSTKRLFTPSDESMSDEEALDELSSLWPEVIADVCRSYAGTPLAAGLSGGLDSRFIAAELSRQGHSPLAYTYGSLETHEATAAAELADVLGFDHLRIAVTSDRLMPDALALAHRLDGSHSPAEMYEDWFSDRLRSIAGAVVNGLAGGPLWGDDKAVGVHGHDPVLSAQMRRYGSELARIRQLLSPDLVDAAEPLIRSGLSESLSEWDTDGRSDIVVYWRVYNRQFRWGNMLTTAMRRNGIPMAAPFFDSRFLRYASRLTPAQRLNGNLYLRAHLEFYPESSRVPRSDDGNALVALDHVYWSGESPLLLQLAKLATRHPVSAGRRLTRRLYENGAVLLQERTSMSQPADRLMGRNTVFPADLWLKSEPSYRQRLIEFLEASPTKAPISDSAFTQAISGLRSGQDRNALLMAKIGTLNAWLACAHERERLRTAALL